MNRYKNVEIEEEDEIDSPVGKGTIKRSETVDQTVNMVAVPAEEEKKE